MLIYALLLALETKIAVASCANERAYPALEAFVAAAAWKPEAVLLLGDTPYIDSTEPSQLAQRHETFRTHPAMAALRAQARIFAVWDDHDFGLNDTDGTLTGKEASRAAFVAAHPEQTCGNGTDGVWTSMRQGDVEAWLLDARWFANTALDAQGKPTLLGEPQWTWLEAGLRNSTATFKLICSGMIFNDATRPGKKDYWGAWPHERQRLFRMLGQHRISGVVLVSGDIHRSRVVRHDTRDLVGYEVTELITSPAAQNPIAAADAPHQGLVFDRAMNETWLALETKTKQAAEANPTTHLLASFKDKQGQTYFETRLWAHHLQGTPRMPHGFVYEELSNKEQRLPYAVHVPRTWAPGGPALLFLHGRGECGSDGQLQLAVGLAPALLRAPSEWPFLVVFPQKPAHDKEWEHYETEVLTMLDAAVHKYGADPRRIALTGLSQGGHGTWELARRNSQLFRAIVPLCGYPATYAAGEMERNRSAATVIAQTLKGLPVWAIHGTADSAVPVALTDMIVDAFRAQGAEVRVSRYEGVGHDCWSRAYADPAVAAFLRAATEPR
jgi:predicted esterase